MSTMSSTADDLRNLPRGESPREEAEDWAQPVGVKQIYERYGDFVWRNLRRLGISEEATDDALQDVFLVVHRRLSDFESRSSVKTWLFGIVLRVAQTHLRSVRRRRVHVDDGAAPSEIESVATSDSEGPAEMVARREASALLHRLLDELDDEKRAILILVELEQMSVPDAAEAMSMNLNTAYSRLRAARQAFQDAVTRHRTLYGSRP
jgi:RNA polymerase sigma-70 factor (ECF subfamily)